ncbi:DsbC family protein [Eoetvoesiella caeni]
MVRPFSGLFLAALAGGILAAGMGAAVAQTSAPAVVSTQQAAAAQPVTPETLAQVKQAFEHRFEGIKVAAVNPTPLPGLFEVQVESDLMYTDIDANYVLQGSLIDARARVDLTAQRLAKLSEVPFDSLPLDKAIKQVRGNGERKIAVFEDPNCGYCKQLHRTLESVDNITIYTLLFPILSPDSNVKARNIWCAKDKAATWRDWMVNAKTPAEAQCDTPIDELLAFGRKLRVQGTPAIFFADGSRVNGALPLDALNKKLASVKVN